MAYELVRLPRILFMFVKIKFIHRHSLAMFAMNSMSICNDLVNHDEIIIQQSLVFKPIL